MDDTHKSASSVDHASKTDMRQCDIPTHYPATADLEYPYSVGVFRVLSSTAVRIVWCRGLGDLHSCGGKQNGWYFKKSRQRIACRTARPCEVHVQFSRTSLECPGHDAMSPLRTAVSNVDPASACGFRSGRAVPTSNGVRSGEIQAI